MGLVDPVLPLAAADRAKMAKRPAHSHSIVSGAHKHLNVGDFSPVLATFTVKATDKTFRLATIDRDRCRKARVALEATRHENGSREWCSRTTPAVGRHCMTNDFAACSTCVAASSLTLASAARKFRFDMADPRNVQRNARCCTSRTC